MKKIIFLIMILLVGAFAKENLTVNQLKKEILAIRNSLTILKGKSKGEDLQKEMRTLANKNTLLRQWKGFNTLRLTTKNKVVFQQIGLIKKNLFLLKKQFPKKIVILRTEKTSGNEYRIGNKTTLLIDNDTLKSVINQIEKNYKKRELIDLMITNLSYIQKIKIPEYFAFKKDVQKIKSIVDKIMSSRTSVLINQNVIFQNPGTSDSITAISQIAITTNDILGNNNLRVLNITNRHIEIGIQ